jgi:hypothetical protein
VGEQYRIRLDDVDRHTIVEALAHHLTSRVRRARHKCSIVAEASLLERLARPKATRPDGAWWSMHWTKHKKHHIYKHIKELVKISKGTVKRSSQGTV